MRQQGLRLPRQLHFGTGGNDDGLGLLFQAHLLRLGQYISALADIVQTAGVGGQIGIALGGVAQVLARQQQRGRLVLVLQCDGPGHCSFSGIAGTPNVQIRNQAQRSGMLDRLVRRAVFAQTDGVMGKHVHHTQLHQRRHANGIAAVIAEGQEGATIGNEATVQGDAVHDGGHAEFTHTVIDVAATDQLAAGVLRLRHRAIGFEAQVWRALGVGQVGAGQVGRATQHFRQCCRERFQCQLRGLAAGHGFGFLVRANDGVDGGLHKILRQLALATAQQLLGQFRESCLVGGKTRIPVGFCRLALGLGVPVGVHRLRNFKRCVRPLDGLARELDFFRTERFAVGLGGVGAVRAALANVGPANDQRRVLGGLLGFCNGAGDARSIMAVDRAQHIPAVADKAQRRVVGKPGRHLAVDRNAVVVVQRNQLVQLPGTGQGCGFVADTFHQAAVAHEHIGVVIHHRMAFAVELLGQQLFSQRHADGIGNALAERARSGFHAGRDAVFGVARSLAVQLAEILQLLHRQLVAGQVQQGINQHRTVAVGQHKAVAVEPLRIARAVLQVLAPQGNGHVRHAHRGSGMAGIGLLNCVHCERTNCAGHLLGVCHGGRLRVRK